MKQESLVGAAGREFAQRPAEIEDAKQQGGDNQQRGRNTRSAAYWI